ncbi:exported protein of unknown function [Sterolibacterium denitrificans]|uniref:Uncharacterized protein n=1 Tax=Sterolibacterium denitrificans TaxID=157592 RepID=A0A7Z7HQ40_9PROT|nr:hypothetical protein [Sterolibacterium denitrificans]SMB24242.1 exported protein of unknown function [Sterolibacterium denitrificans]
MNQPHRLSQTLRFIRRIFLCGLFCLVLPTMAAPAGTPATRVLGSLFYSPAERLAMQRQRASERPTTASAPASGSVHKLDGLVRHSSGSSTVWLNRQAMTTESASLLLGKPMAHDALRIGEIRDLTSGRRDDLLPPGSIEIQHQP